MFRSDLILRFRALWRNRLHTAINVIGLSLGITSSVVIFLILRFEYSYDTFRADGDRIYRVVKKFDDGKVPSFQYSAMTYPLAPAMRNDFAQVEYVALLDAQQSVIRIHRTGAVEKFHEDHIVFVDSTYFNILPAEWINGNQRALAPANTVVLTESIARKYFGDEDPMNKIINYNSEFDLTVSGIVKDPPLNTDFRFDIYISNNLGSVKRGWDDWGATSSNVNCLVKLRAGVTHSRMEEKLKGWHLKYEGGDNAKHERVLLQPLAAIHFDNEFWNPGGRIVSRASLLTLALIGGVLLLTACVNFINLNSVLVIDRAREVGVRKVMGSSRLLLVTQFLSETVLITLISILLSSGLVELMLIQLSPVLGYRLPFLPFADWTIFIFLSCVLASVTLLAGLYPAFRLAGFQPIDALKNNVAGGVRKGLTLRRSLIVFQLVISQVLIVCTIIAVQQMHHFMSQPLGLNSHAVVEFKIPENGADKMRLLADRMLAISGVENFTASNTGAIAYGQWTGNFAATVNNQEISEYAIAKMADENYIDTYGISLLYGENLVRADTTTRFLVNETFVKALGLTDPREAIGVSVELWGHRSIVTGIVKDFNAESLHSKIVPTVIMCSADSYRKGAVRVKVENMQKTLAQVRETWEGVFPNYVYEQNFLDDVIRGLYDAERNVSYLIGLFAGIAILIGCIGLFGLISYMARSRTKEVGIRRTLGASVVQVVALFSKEFVTLVVIAFVISVPVTYWFMDEWLRKFEYHIQPGATAFLAGLLFTCMVVFLTVGSRAYRAAAANPVNALRDE